MSKTENKKYIYGLIFGISSTFCCLVFNSNFNEEKYLNRVLISEAFVKFGSLNSAEKAVQNLKSITYQNKVLDKLGINRGTLEYVNAIKAMESAKVLRSKYLELTFEDSKSNESLWILELIGQYIVEEQNNRIENNIKLFSKEIIYILRKYDYLYDEYKRCNLQDDEKYCKYFEERITHLENEIKDAQSSLFESLEKARVMELESIKIQKYSSIMLLTFSAVLGYLLGLIFYELILVGRNTLINLRKSTGKNF